MGCLGSNPATGKASTLLVILFPAQHFTVLKHIYNAAFPLTFLFSAVTIYGHTSLAVVMCKLLLGSLELQT